MSDLAQHLRTAVQGGPTVTPAEIGGLAEAYSIARATRTLALANGETLAGYKVGLTSPSSRAVYQATEPASGYVLTSTVLKDGEPLQTAGLSAPRAEVEIAFLLAEPLTGPGITPADVLAATASIAPAFELVASRWTGGPKTLEMLVADNTNASHVLLGEPSPVPADLSTITCTLTIGDHTVEGNATAVMNGNPAASVAWLANHLAESGDHLQAGHLILTGTLCPPTPFTAGDTLKAEIPGLGSLTLTTK
ncbi:2-keto-4-pentenoate hydratase [Amycolatopsis sp. FDAARGOS 1241]|uniref:2-keto-4-pentenoate hydratase n=1 Tax=Amycolatopsis sp. FDAARGOS 1241 TaxID=2778070 RepID=UPI0019524512|nr:fumarylacetoacetate hydrolase family protein [Amycolatopsis sp. FDAARGOS 1241]QRP48125.1 fumarylacetoacetate hydrolase family protein [Amycolatopsis sp. FDAARGOS 1241]